MSDIIELPDESAIVSVHDFLAEQLPTLVARLNDQTNDQYKVVMPEIHAGYVEPSLATTNKFPYISIWTPVDEMEMKTRVMMRGDLEIRCMIVLLDRPDYAKILMYRYTAMILHAVHKDRRLGNRVGLATYFRSRYYTPTWNQDLALEMYVGESYLSIEQEVYRS
jgi:hypothetical protein